MRFSDIFLHFLDFSDNSDSENRVFENSFLGQKNFQAVLAVDLDVLAVTLDVLAVKLLPHPLLFHLRPVFFENLRCNRKSNAGFRASSDVFDFTHFVRFLNFRFF